MQLFSFWNLLMAVFTTTWDFQKFLGSYFLESFLMAAFENHYSERPPKRFHKSKNKQYCQYCDSSGLINYKQVCDPVVHWLSLLHNFIHQNQINSGSTQVQILNAACQRFDGKDLWQWSRLEIRLHAFRWSTILQKKFMIN